MRLEPGLTAAVTGAASGIGRGLATAFAARGMNVLLMDLDEAMLGEVADEVRSLGGAAAVAHTDVRHRAALGAARGVALERFGQVDVLCNNAGVIGPWRPTWAQREEDWAWLYEVNVMGTVHGISTFVPDMVQRGSGHIVNTTSINALVPIPQGGNAPYAATKAAVLAVSETLATDFTRLELDIGVTAVLPGPVATALRESELRRPVEHGPRGSGPVLPPVEFSYERITAEVAAARVLAAIEDNRRYVLTNDGSDTDVRSRIDQLLAEGSLR